MGDDIIRYDVLVQEALRGVVRKVLTEVARAGLPGDHHFYIAFDTRAPGVRMSSRLKERHPEEMTIILQHQYWDLTVTDQAFEVGLSFGGVPERLLIPFTAIKGIFDPSVKFGLEFEVEMAAEASEETAESPLAKPVAAPLPSATPPTTGLPAPAAAAEDAPAPAAEDKSASVVSLDAFRKKT